MHMNYIMDFQLNSEANRNMYETQYECPVVRDKITLWSAFGNPCDTVYCCLALHYGSYISSSAFPRVLCTHLYTCRAFAIDLRFIYKSVVKKFAYECQVPFMVFR